MVTSIQLTSKAFKGPKSEQISYCQLMNFNKSFSPSTHTNAYIHTYTHTHAEQ